MAQGRIPVLPLFHVLFVVAGVEAGMLGVSLLFDNPFIWHLLVEQGGC